MSSDAPPPRRRPTRVEKLQHKIWMLEELNKRQVEIIEELRSRPQIASDEAMEYKRQAEMYKKFYIKAVEEREEFREYLLEYFSPSSTSHAPDGEDDPPGDCTRDNSPPLLNDTAPDGDDDPAGDCTRDNSPPLLNDAAPETRENS
ncbi:uncharacterized protein LOC125952212 [Anopheles darlingi]|uniref:uncharacterized protein LOC125952211 n=1 Tax=Anopheles darlingi TaxID=43151 RepID=UPI0021004E7C|nr:uncharacterized protein LOC125952211 [Anopheles darlingi]XP_049537507.1 uncharacterized protein LOC125952212 [Anopheles darlingi]